MLKTGDLRVFMRSFKFCICLFLTIVAVACGADSTPSPTSKTPPTELPPTPTIIAPTETPAGATPAAPIPSQTVAPAGTMQNRLADPVVMLGSDLPALLGVAPANLVAFRFSEAGWQQVAVQVDERSPVDLRRLSGRNGDPDYTILTYTDPNTQIGPDPDPTFDGDDELVFMAKDVGTRPEPFSPPAGVNLATGVHITLSDPLDPAGTGHIYLFEQDGSLAPAGNFGYVTYDYLAGQETEKDKDTLSGQNTTSPVTENSTITTSVYRHHFSARWILDELYLGGSDRDLIDRFRVQLTPQDCDRSEDTFSAGDGAFIVNKSGPVRVVRAYIGANSGTYTERLHLFYEQRQEMTTFLRVHALPGVTDYLDWSAEATGMSYYSNLLPAGTTIDGLPDNVPAGTLQWELVTGEQGSLITAYTVQTDMPNFNHSSFYLDSFAPPQAPCSGDGQVYGASGIFVYPLECTDIARAAVDPQHCAIAYNMALTRIITYAPPNQSPETAQLHYNQSQAPLIYTVEPIQ